MKRLILTSASIAFVILQGIAFPFNITGKVYFQDRTVADGAIITLTAPEDNTVQPKSDTIGSDGTYQFSIGNFFEPPRLIDIKVEKTGYQTLNISKVIIRSFVLEDLFLVEEGMDVYKPYLHIIAKSESGHNLVAWEREKDLDINYYIVKRKNLSGVFDSIGNVKYNAEYSIYIDQEADVIHSSFYQIEAVFNDGTKSLPSNTRKSFELTFDLLNDKKPISLVFDLQIFEGLEYPADEISTVQLLKSTDGRTFDTLGEKFLNEITYEELFMLLPPDTLRKAGKYMYKVRVNYKDTCYPGVLKSDSGPFSQSLSNLAEAIILDTDINGDPIDTTSSPVRSSGDFGNIQVYPIPSDGKFVVESAGQSRVIITSLSGETIIDLPFENRISVTDSRIIPGIYTVSVIGNGETKMFRQVIK